jgi:hypothetical protein
MFHESLPGFPRATINNHSDAEVITRLRWSMVDEKMQIRDAASGSR